VFRSLWLLECLTHHRLWRILGYSTTLFQLNELYEGESKSFRTGRLERELQVVQLTAIRCSCIAILWVSLVNFAVITLYVASRRMFIVVSVMIQSGNFWLHPSTASLTWEGGYKWWKDMDWKEVGVFYFKVLSWHFPRETEGTNDKTQSR
jgi:hypothetical protein